MSDHDRGAYTPPTEPPLAFDARQPVRGSRPAPLTLIISTLVLVALAVAIVMFYRSGVRQAGEAPRAIGTPVGDLKTAPPPEAQPVDPAAGLQIYKSEDGETEGQPQFAPPPEQPQPRAAPTTPVTSAPAAAGLKPAQPAPNAAPAPAPAPKAAPAPAPAPKAVTPPPKAAPAATPAPATTGGASVQIGAFSSQALADSNWAEAVRTPGGAGKGKHVEIVPGRGLYRTTVTGFASRAEATAFCNALKADGKACFVK